MMKRKVVGLAGCGWSQVSGKVINIIPITSSHPGEIWNEILHQDGADRREPGEPHKTLLTVIIKNNTTDAVS